MHRSLPASVRLASSAALLALAACAPAASNPSPEQVALTPTTTRVETPDGAMEARTMAEDRSVVQTIKAAPDVAWSKLPAVYGELQIPVTGYVDPAKQIMSKGTRLRGRLGKLRLSQIITCGTDITGDDKANTYEVSLDVSTVVSPAANGQANVSSMVTANARPMATSGDPVRCVTTGSLERRIANAILVKTATP